MRALAAILAASALLAAGCGQPGSFLYAEAGALYDAGRYAESFPLMRKAAEGGNTHAMALLGVMYLHGRGVAADGRAAERWLVRAAERGEVGAQSLAGIMYATGIGVPPDPEKARRWLTIAAENGDAQARRLLAQGKGAVSY